MKKYKEITNNHDKLLNTLAVYILLDHGRVNLLDKDYYKELYKDIESGKTRNPYITKKQEKEILDISIEMAKLEHDDIYDFIQNEIDLSQKSLEKENDNISTDYEY